MSDKLLTPNTASQHEVKVWDPLVRIFHWSLVALFVLAYLSGEELEDLHPYFGYTITGLLAFRVVWGFFGTRYARFSNFVYSPSTITAYLKSLLTSHPKHYLGHNPAGGAMILVLLVSLTCIVVSGMGLLATEGHGPLAGTFFSAFTEDAMEEVHEFFVNFTLLLVVIHIAGVIVSSRLHSENLVKAMVTGRKVAQPEDESQA